MEKISFSLSSPSCRDLVATITTNCQLGVLEGCSIFNDNTTPATLWVKFISHSTTFNVLSKPSRIQFPFSCSRLLHLTKYRSVFHQPKTVVVIDRQDENFCCDAIHETYFLLFSIELWRDCCAVISDCRVRFLHLFRATDEMILFWQIIDLKIYQGHRIENILVSFLHRFSPFISNVRSKSFRNKSESFRRWLRRKWVRLVHFVLEVDSAWWNRQINILKILARESVWKTSYETMKNSEWFRRTRQLVLWTSLSHCSIECFRMFSTRAVPLARMANKENTPMCWWMIRKFFIYFTRRHSI